MSQSPMISQVIDKGAACGMKFLLQEFANRDINGGDGSAVSLQSIGVGKRHCRLLIIPAQPELILIPLLGKVNCN
ncbi:hypothetical protein [Microcoleus sp. MOSTC5]